MTVFPELMNDEDFISEATITIYPIAGIQEIKSYSVFNGCRHTLSCLQSNLCVGLSYVLSQTQLAIKPIFSEENFIARKHNTVVRVLQDQVKSL